MPASYTQTELAPPALGPPAQAPSAGPSPSPTDGPDWSDPSWWFKDDPNSGPWDSTVGKWSWDGIVGFFGGVGDFLGGAFDWVVAGGISRFWNMMSEFILGRLVGSEKGVIAAFLLHPTPFVGPGLPLATDRTAPSGTFDVNAVWATGHLMWLSLVVAVVSLGVAGGRLLWNHARGYHQTLRTVLSGLVTMVVASLLVVYAVKVMLWAGDSYSAWVLVEAGTFEQSSCLSPEQMAPRTYLAMTQLGVFVALALGMQILLMSFRGALLMLLASTIVIPAASATTEAGRKWLNKYVCWMLAFICLKPATATLFAVAGMLYDPKEGCRNMSFEEILGGPVLMAAGAFALPALLRILTPGSVTIAEPFAASGSWLANYTVREFSNRLAWSGPSWRRLTGSRGGGSSSSGSSSSGSGSGGGSRSQRWGRRAAAGTYRVVRRTAGIGTVPSLGLNNVHAYQDNTNEIIRELDGDGDDGPLGSIKHYESDWT